MQNSIYKIISLVAEDLKKEKNNIIKSYKPYLHVMYIARSRFVHYCLIESSGNGAKSSSFVGTNRRTFNNALGFFIEEWSLFNLEKNLTNADNLVVEKALNDLITLLKSNDLQEYIFKNVSKYDLFIGIVKHQFSKSLLHYFNDNIYQASIAFNFNRRTFSNCLNLNDGGNLPVINYEECEKKYFSTLKVNLNQNVKENEKLHTVSFNLEESLITRIENMSKNNNISYSAQIRDLLKKRLT